MGAFRLLPRDSGAFRPALVAVLGLVLFPATVPAQLTGGCDVPSHQGLTTLSLSNGSRIAYFSLPTFVCSGNTRITADSAVFYQATDYVQLFRNVTFRDADRSLTADEAHYFQQENRLRAWGQVILTDRIEGSIIRGDTVLLLRAEPGRPEDQLTVWGRRPHATLYPTRQEAADAEAGEAEPVGVPIPTDTAAGPPADTTAGLPADSTAGPPADTTAGLPADSAAGPPADTTAGTPADTLAGGPPDPGAGPPLDTAVVGNVPRPTAVPPPEAGPRTPYEIYARRMFLEGSRFFRAAGGVTIDRDSVHAVADSVEYDGSAGALLLSREARLTTSAYDLSGATIRLDIPQDEIRTVEARDEALLEGEDLWLLAPSISLMLSGGEVERLVAVQAPPGDSAAGPEGDTAAVAVGGTGREVPLEVREKGLEHFPRRPHAIAQDFLLWADSIEVIAPGQELDELWAMGSAHGESMARDSLNTPETDPLLSRDWLEGDTIVAIFVPGGDSIVAGVEGPEEQRTVPSRPAPDVAGEAPADSARYRLDRLIARVGARSLYRLPPSDSTLVEEDRRLAVHYVLGNEITIIMKGGEVDRMEVVGNTRGIHLEPVAIRRRGVPPDTTAASPVRGPGGGR